MKSPSNLSLSLIVSTHLYQVLIALYPPEFRRVYGSAMQQLFRDCCRRALRESGTVGLLSLWGRTLYDFVKSVIEEHTQRGVSMSKQTFFQVSGWAMMIGPIIFLIGAWAMTRPPYHPNNFSSLPIDRYAVPAATPLLVVGMAYMPGSGPPFAYSLQTLDLSAGLVGFVFGAVTGLAVAGLQWIILKAWLPEVRGWLLLNGVAFGLVHAVNDAGLFNSLSDTLSLMIDGLVIGVAQAVALRHALLRSYIWPLVMSIAWFFGFKSAFAFEMVYGNDHPLTLLIANGTAGLIIGGIMAIFLTVIGTIKFRRMPCA